MEKPKVWRLALRQRITSETPTRYEVQERPKPRKRGPKPNPVPNLDANDNTLSFALSANLRDRLDKMAERQVRSRSELIRELIEAGLEAAEMDDA